MDNGKYMGMSSEYEYKWKLKSRNSLKGMILELERLELKELTKWEGNVRKMFINIGNW